MNDVDADLLGRFVAGDRGALETLYWRHAERVWRFGRHFSGSPDGAEDIVQETFLRVARSAGTFNGRSRFTTWLYAVARSAALDLAAKTAKTPPVAGDDLVAQVPSSNPGPADRAATAESREVVRQAVAGLPENERLAVVLCGLQELSIREAAQALDWGESRVKTTLYRARRRLRDALSPRPDTG